MSLYAYNVILSYSEWRKNVFYVALKKENKREDALKRTKQLKFGERKMGKRCVFYRFSCASQANVGI